MTIFRFLLLLFLILLSCGRGSDSTGTRVGTETQIAFLDTLGLPVVASYSLRALEYTGLPWDSLPKAIFSGIGVDTSLIMQDSLFMEAYSADSSLGAWKLISSQESIIAVPMSITDSYSIRLSFLSDTIVSAWYGFPGTGRYGQVNIRSIDTLELNHVVSGIQNFTLYLKSFSAVRQLHFRIAFPGMKINTTILVIDELLVIMGENNCVFQIDAQGLLATESDGGALCQ
ncbi:MAG: hypothetical protein AUK31_05275 [Fibrobacteres bacterium CG2_30_45_31]|nr:MAG: hypothetical protein AUK31_05275 [Fibrobacteres bacterium CG2_30_45_31]